MKFDKKKLPKKKKKFFNQKKKRYFLKYKNTMNTMYLQTISNEEALGRMSVY